MVVAARRTCRTCPSVISEHGSTGQCRPCQERSAAVREAVGVISSPVVEQHPRSCQAGHHGCSHFVMLFRAYEEFVDDCDVCAACGSEGDGSGSIKHAPQCVFWVLKEGGFGE